MKTRFKKRRTELRSLRWANEHAPQKRITAMFSRQKGYTIIKTEKPPRTHNVTDLYS